MTLARFRIPYVHWFLAAQRKKARRLLSECLSICPSVRPSFTLVSLAYTVQDIKILFTLAIQQCFWFLKANFGIMNLGIYRRRVRYRRQRKLDQ